MSPPDSSTLLIGAHTSAAGGVHNALLQGKSIGATTIQLFTSNQRQWKGRVFTPNEIDLWKAALEETGLSSIMSHDSYLINLGAPDPEILAKSRQAFLEEIVRCQQLELTFLNFHPGAARKGGSEQCIELIVESLLSMEKQVEKGSLRLLIECTAGQGSCVGCSFQELHAIIDRVKDRLPIGVCIDTCHAFASGYDLRTPETIDKVLNEFDQIVGLKYLYALHLNDSAKDLGSRVDRHKPLGEGKIGIECFRYLMKDPRTRNVPKYLETPDGPPLWIKEIALLRSFV